jgi:hypothetical protein
MKVKYYATKPGPVTVQQQIIADGRFGLVRNLLVLFGELDFHQLAYRLKQYKDSHGEDMLSEEELGYQLLRLVGEGLVGMKNVGPCREKCCALDNVEEANAESGY